MKYDIQEHLKPRGLTGISDEQIEQHWHLYEGYVKNTNDLLGEIETTERGSRKWGELKRRLGFEFNGMVLHEYYFGNLAAGATLRPGSELAAALAADWGAISAWREGLARAAMEGRTMERSDVSGNDYAKPSPSTWVAGGHLRLIRVSGPRPAATADAG